MVEKERFCPNCGTAVASDDIHCSRCGGKLSAGGSSGTLDESGATFVQGALIREYRVAGLLGVGGVGEVYRVLHVHTGQQFALKVLHAHMMANEKIRARFIQEGRALAQMNHPNVVQVYNLFEENGRFFLVMDFVAGRALDEILEESGPLPLETAVGLTCDVLAALGHAHTRNPPLIHRDIKPANILVAEDGRAVVTDFGIARFQGDKRFTQAGGVVGTPEYMSPEQVQGHDVGPAADLYSVGVLFYELLTGRVPFPQTGEVYWPVIKAHMEDPPPPLDVPGLPHGVQEAVDRALLKEPARRFADATEFAGALRTTISGDRQESEQEQQHIVNEDSPPRPPPPPPPPTKAGGVPKWVLVGVVAMAAVALFVIGSQLGNGAAESDSAVKVKSRKRAETETRPAPEPDPAVAKEDLPAERPSAPTPVPIPEPSVSEPPAPEPAAPEPVVAAPVQVEPPPCVPDCARKDCGADGCGGSCGSCTSPKTCQRDHCVCTPDCAGKDCGADACGGSCGDCRWGERCRAERCVLDVDAVRIPAEAYHWHERNKLVKGNLNGFCIDRHEVSFKQYKKCVTRGDCDPIPWGDCIHLVKTRTVRRKDTGRVRPKWHGEDHPVICASFQDARDYCRSRGGAVPTVAQWEAAAGGPGPFLFLYPWGSENPSDHQVNACGTECPFYWSEDASWKDRYEFTAPPGRQVGGASYFEAEDMAGNVWEWATRTDGSLVWKGGAWNSNIGDLRVAQEYDNVKRDSRWNSAGFRCVYPESACK